MSSFDNRILRKLISRDEINLVHQPTPVSPRYASFMFGLGVPVIIGPINGGMDYPAAFRKTETLLTRRLVDIAAPKLDLVNSIIPGKANADVLFVANRRARCAIPSARGRVIKLCENGVDLNLWSPARSQACETRRQHFVFMGRLIVEQLDLAIEALARFDGAVLEVIGDGPHAAGMVHARATAWIRRSRPLHRLVAPKQMRGPFHGATTLLLPQRSANGRDRRSRGHGDRRASGCDGLGRPSRLYRRQLPGLWSIQSSTAMIDGFTEAMSRLLNDPDCANASETPGSGRVERRFNWEKKSIASFRSTGISSRPIFIPPKPSSHPLWSSSRRTSRWRPITAGLDALLRSNRLA